MVTQNNSETFANITVFTNMITKNSKRLLVNFYFEGFILEVYGTSATMKFKWWKESKTESER